MLQLLGQDPRIQESIKSAKQQIKNLKFDIQKKAQGRNLEALPQVTDTSKQSNPRILDLPNDRREPEFRTRKRLTGHFGKIYSLHWSSDSNDIVSASQDGKLLVWNAHTTNKKVAIPLRSAWVMTCAFSPDGRLVASGGLDNLCSIFQIGDNLGWEIKSASYELQQHEGYLSCCRFVNDNEILTSSGDGTIILWDIQQQHARMTFSEHGGDVQSVAVAPDDPNQFVSGAIDAQAKTWDMRSGECAASFTGHESDINDVQWFPNGKAFVSGSDDATCRLFDIRAHCQLAKYHGEDIYSTVTEVDFSKSGRYLFAGYDEEPFCLVWDTASAQRKFTLTHETRAGCLQVSPNGMALATGCWDKILRVWA